MRESSTTISTFCIRSRKSRGIASSASRTSAFERLPRHLEDLLPTRLAVAVAAARARFVAGDALARSRGGRRRERRVVAAQIARVAAIAQWRRPADPTPVKDQRRQMCASSASVAPPRTAASRRLRDRPTPRCPDGLRREARGDPRAGRVRRAHGPTRRSRSCVRRRAAPRAQPCRRALRRSCRSTSARAAPTIERALLRKNPVETISGSTASGSTAASARASGYFGKERRRDDVDARVGGLRGKDRRDQQLERRAVMELGVGIRDAAARADRGWRRSRHEGVDRPRQAPRCQCTGPPGAAAPTFRSCS